MEATFRYILKHFLDPYVSGLDGKINYSVSAVNIFDLKIRDELLNQLREGNVGPLDLQEARIGALTLQAVDFGRVQVTASEVVFDLNLVPVRALGKAWAAGREEREAAAPGFVQLVREASTADGYWSALLGTAVPASDEIRANYCLKHISDRKRRRAGVRVIDCRICGEKVRTNFTCLALCILCSLRSGRCLHCGSSEVPTKIPFQEETEPEHKVLSSACMVLPLGEMDLLEDGFSDFGFAGSDSERSFCAPPPSSHAQDQPAVPPQSRKGPLLGAGLVPSGPREDVVPTDERCDGNASRPPLPRSSTQQSGSATPSRCVTPSGPAAPRWETSFFELPPPRPKRGGGASDNSNGSDSSDCSATYSAAHREILQARKKHEELQRMKVPDTEDPCRPSSSLAVNVETMPALAVQRKVRRTRHVPEDVGKTKVIDAEQAEAPARRAKKPPPTEEKAESPARSAKKPPPEPPPDPSPVKPAKAKDKSVRHALGEPPETSRRRGKG